MFLKLLNYFSSGTKVDNTTIIAVSIK